MALDLIHKGIVTYVSREKKFGFLDADFGKEIFFFAIISSMKGFSGEGGKIGIRIFMKGDEVWFKLRESTREEGKFEAFDLQSH